MPFVIASTLLAVLSLAGAPSTVAPSSAGAGPAESTPDPLGARRDDGGMDQAWASPTALTQPAGTLTVHDHEVLVVGLTWAPIDRLQIAVAGATVVSASAVITSAKMRILDVSRFHLAVLAGALFDAMPHTTASHYFAGAVVSVCLNSSCGALVSAYGMAGPYERTGSMDDGGGSTGTRLLYGGNALIPVAPHFKLVLEVDMAGFVNCQIGCTPRWFDMVMPIAGVRYHTGPVGVMLGVAAYSEVRFASPPETGTSFEVDLWPVVSASYRFGGQ